MIRASGYLEEVLPCERLQSHIARVTDLLFSHIDEFDAIAFRGASGALVAPAVAVTLNKQLIMVRKPSEYGHSDCVIEGWLGRSARYVIVDDFISSGNTITKILEAVSNTNNKHTCVAIVTYNSRGRSTVHLNEYRGIPIWKAEK